MLKKITSCTTCFLLYNIIIFYRILLAPLLTGTCRFQISCSAYALHVLKNSHRYGLTKAVVLVSRRLASCHPFS